MTILLSGTNGLFTRVGTLGHLLNDVNACAGTTVPADAQLINNQFFQNEAYIDGMAAAVSSYQSSIQGILSWVQQTAQSLVIDMANADVDLPDSTLFTALNELIYQMNVSGVFVKPSVVSMSVVANAHNTTDGVIVGSLKSATGVQLDDAYNEQVQINVVADAIIGGAVLGQEALSFAGGASQSNMLTYLWPSGSGATITLNAIDAASATSNKLNNGGFENWTIPNTPDNWTIALGTPGVQILKTTAHVYKGTAALQLTSDGSQKTCLQQVPSSFTALTQFAVNLWMGQSAIPASGALELALVDYLGNYINDQAGTPNKQLIQLSGAGTAYAPYNVAFRLPLLIPSGATFQMRYNPPPAVSDSTYIDQLGFAPMVNQYPGGPWWLAFSGLHQFTELDAWIGQTNNNYSGLQQALWNRLMNMSQFPLLLPASANFNIPDAY